MWDPGAVIALAALIFTVISTIFAFTVRAYVARISELNRENELLRARNEVIQRTLDAKQETINEQHRQLDRLMITAEIQERFFRQMSQRIPPSRTGDQA